MTLFGSYLAAIAKNLAEGGATEHTHRPALKSLLEAMGKDIIATNEPTHILCGAPDFIITRAKVPLGHVETKDIGENFTLMERGRPPYGEQFSRYRDGLPNWVLTDYLEFRWFVNGEHRLTARLAELDKKGKLKAVAGGEEAVANLLKAFVRQKALTISTPKDLAQRMAGMTRIIRDLIINSFEHEIQRGLLHNWLAAFREVLIPDLDEKQFADMFAQTLAYGLFAARIHAPPKEQFTRKCAAYCIPKTNPFLRKLFSEIAGVDMPETIAWAVDDLVELLKHADMFSILKDFGKGKGKKDPVVHFYETLLAAYDPRMRELRGVFYTPEEVVGYIVRSVDCLLGTRFNRPKGLADENTLVLDPATGTATFLYFVINQIYQKFARQKGAWDGYVEKHLLDRIFGFELLMAPYAIAHLKLGMLLHETGYTFGSDQRLGIFLTNTLEAAAKHSEHLIANWISEEANAAAKIKRDDPVLVVLGNPPYSGHSANRSIEKIRVEKGRTYLAGFELTQGKINRVTRKATQTGDVEVPNFIGGLLTDYYVADGAWLDEKNPKWLQDDYVKFIRFAQWRIDRTGEGIIGFITNNGYLDNPTFRGMRQNLMSSFSDIYVLDLHGSAKKQEKTSDGSSDENVFDIQQGVSIMLCVKERGGKYPARVHYAGLLGTREAKYQFLSGSDVRGTDWKPVAPSKPFYLFVPQNSTLKAEYGKGWSVVEAFPVNVLGFQTHRDHFAISFDEQTLRSRVSDLRNRGMADEEIRVKYAIPDNRDWTLSRARAELRGDPNWEKAFAKCLYRPFDFRHCYFSQVAMDYPRRELLDHVAGRENLCLGFGRQGLAVNDPQWSLAALAAIPIDANVFRRGGINVCPLYLYAEGELGLQSERHPNLGPAFLKSLAAKLKLPQGQPHGLPEGVAPEDIFHYAYAMVHSPAYRTRYGEFLKIDFPRLPLTSSPELFRSLAGKGAELAGLHLMESPGLSEFITEFAVKGDNEVEKAQYTDNDQRVWINSKQYFSRVPKAVWEFQIGGYQVCEKWLKERQGRKLAYDDLQHYQKIVVVLNETIRLMKEIDAAIPSWPVD